MRLKSLKKKLTSQVKKAQLNITQLQTVLDSVAQAYIQQEDDIIEDLKNRMIEAIEKMDLQKKAGPPVIKL